MREHVVTAGDMRRLEQRFVDEGGSFASLMRRAGEAVATRFIETMYSSAHRNVLILCGNGNNGGDGFVIAEKLCEKTDARVTVMLLCGEPTAEPAKGAYEQLKTTAARVLLLCEDTPLSAFYTDIATAEPDYVIDAVYGIGFHGNMPAHVAEILSSFSGRVPVMAVDIPSGIGADNGMIADGTLRADRTVTFAALKPAMMFETAAAFCGEIDVADVGIEESVRRQFETTLHVTSAQDVRNGILPRSVTGHKGTFGSVLSVCGSYGMAGAAMLCGKAALRCGVGLLHMALPRSIYPIVSSNLWEAVYHPLEETAQGSLSEAVSQALETLAHGKQAVVVGCGLSKQTQTAALLQRFLPTVTAPLILDADGLNCVAEHIDVLKAIKAPLVLTPHPAEMARLLGTAVAAVEKDRIAAAGYVAREYAATVVLKGHRTVIATPEGEIWINPTGCSGMATGGSGDVLSGMIAAFAARGGSLTAATIAAVYLHGLCGEETAKRWSQTGMLPTDMLDTLPSLLSKFERME